MKLNQESVSIETDSPAETQLQVTVGDASLAMEVLVDRLYQDKLRVILQEYACNARDAHREAGKPDEPIRIDLPGTLNPTLRIQDFGLGISSDRAAEVFSQLGRSTKRSDNNQTGGFGIGGKCGYAYHMRMFTVHTVYAGERTLYTCYRRGTGDFVMDVTLREPTDLPSGTTIGVPIALRDVMRLRDLASFLFFRWKPAPIFNMELPRFGTLLDGGDGWAIVETRSKYDYIVVDSVPYELREHACHSPSTLLELPCGAVSIAASREYVEKTDQNTAVIKAHEDRVGDAVRRAISLAYYNPDKSLFSQIDHLCGVSHLDRCLSPESLSRIEVLGNLYQIFTVKLNAYSRKIMKWNKGGRLGYRVQTEGNDKIFFFAAGTPQYAIKDLLLDQFTGERGVHWAKAVLLSPKATTEDIRAIAGDGVTLLGGAVKKSRKHLCGRILLRTVYNEQKLFTVSDLQADNTHLCVIPKGKQVGDISLSLLIGDIKLTLPPAEMLSWVGALSAYTQDSAARSEVGALQKALRYAVFIESTSKHVKALQALLPPLPLEFSKWCADSILALGSQLALSFAAKKILKRYRLDAHRDGLAELVDTVSPEVGVRVFRAISEVGAYAGGERFVHSLPKALQRVPFNLGCFAGAIQRVDRLLQVVSSSRSAQYNFLVALKPLQPHVRKAIVDGLEKGLGL